MLGYVYSNKPLKKEDVAHRNLWAENQGQWEQNRDDGDNSEDKNKMGEHKV